MYDMEAVEKLIHRLRDMKSYYETVEHVANTKYGERKYHIVRQNKPDTFVLWAVWDDCDDISEIPRRR